ncbi:hypothetical protein B6U99_01050 [Candidatus Geothermarchaeota archaeon ex4572_27]|nr:MAG: hypothetical protein B6U99_01050 [Candidatus Geothermarchaeota archaeon ex4572_27]
MLDNWSIVVSGKGLPVGVITDRDILRGCITQRKDMDRCSVGEITSSPLITIETDKPLSKAWTLMTETGVGKVYVVEKVG